MLFDTQLLIWSAKGDARLPTGARALLLDPAIAPVFSAASIWEVAIKAALGRNDFPVDAGALARGLQGAGYEELPVTARHAAALRALPYPGPEGHEDPFDRLLLAQARHEGIALPTTDEPLSAYGEDVMRVR
jgi:PIN domain nuclease of toxin-antitoxin system